MFYAWKDVAIDSWIVQEKGGEQETFLCERFPRRQDVLEELDKRAQARGDLSPWVVFKSPAQLNRERFVARARYAIRKEMGLRQNRDGSWE